MKKSCILFLITMLCSIVSFGQVSPIVGPTHLCVGDTVVYADSSGTGFWSSGSTSVATIGTADGMLVGLSAGATVITYFHPPTGIATLRVTVDPIPTISGPTSIIVGTTTTLTATPPGGGWTGGCPGVLSIDHTSGRVTGIGGGFCCFTYTSSRGCVATFCLMDSVAAGPGPIVGHDTTCVGGTLALTDSTGGGTWTSSNTSIATISSSGIVTGVAAGTCIITYTTIGGFVTFPVTIRTAPTITGPSVLCVGNTITLTGTPSGGIWSSSITSVATVSGGVVTGMATGTAIILYSSGSCTVYHPVTVNPGPPAISGPGSVAVGGTITLTDPSPGGVWFSSNTSIALIGSTTGIVTGVSTGTCTISYYVGGGCFALKTIVVGTTSGGIMPITGASGTCVGSSTGLTDSTAGGTWSSSNTAIATVSATGIVTGVSAGTCIITYTVGTSYVTRTFVVTSGATISGPSIVCVGSTITLAGSPLGGTWISGNTSIASVGSSTGVVTGITGGVVNIYYSSGGCYAYHITTVTAAPPAITGTLSTMVGTSTTLADAAPGGTWSSSTPSIATVGSSTGIVTGVSAGTCAITYSVGACFVRVYFTVTTTTSAIAPIVGPSSTCVGASITLMDSTAGGTWSSSNTSIATVTSTGVVTGVSAGTCTITYMVGSAYVTRSITVSTGSYITGASTLCAGSTITLTGGPVGGTWTSSTTSVATVSSAGVVSGVTGGTATIYYNSGGCYSYHPVTVIPSPAAIGGTTTIAVGGTSTLTDATAGGTWSSSNPSIASVNPTTGVVTGISAGTTTITYSIGGCYRTVGFSVSGPTSILPITGSSGTCTGSSVALHDSTPGGTWSSSNPSVATVSSTGVVTGVSAGTATITYTVGSSYVTRSFTVTSGATITGGGSTICAGATMTLTGSPAGGTWASSNTAVATVGSTTGVLTGITAGMCNIYYNAGSGCYAYRVVTVNPAAAVTGASVICGSLSSATLTASISGGIWSSSNTSVATVSSSGVVTPVGPGTVTIYYLSGVCYTPHFMTVNATAAISGSSTVCIGSTTTLSGTPSGGTWSSSSPSVATVGSTGIVTGMSSGVATIIYSAGGCTASKTVTVSAAASISGSSMLCGGASTTFTGSPSGGTWTSGNTSIATVSSTGLVTATGTGVVNIYYSIGSGCAAFRTVSVNPAVTISGATGVCLGSTTTLSGSPSGGTWISSNTSVATVSSSGVVTPVTTGTVTVTYVISTAGGCYASRTMTITSSAAITSTPSTVCTGSSITMTATPGGGSWSSSNPSVATVSSAGMVTGLASGVTTITYSSGGCSATRTVTVNAGATIGGASSLCVGSSTTLSASPSGGTWSTSNPSVATVSTSTGVVTSVSIGVVTMSYTLGGCSATRTMTITAAAAITGSSSVCTGSTITLSATSGGTWSTSNPSLATVSSSGVVTGIGTGTVTISFSSGGCTATHTVTVTTTTVSLSGTATLCIGSTTTLSGGPSGGTWSSSNTAVATVSSAGVVSGVSAGTATITYATPSGCPATRTVTVSTGATISGTGSSICAGTTISLTGTPSGGTWTSSSGLVASVSSTGVVTGVASGTATIYYNSGGCYAYRMVTVSIPPVAIYGPSTVCTGSAITLTDAVGGGAWSTSNPAVATVSTTGVVVGVAVGTVTIYYSVGSCTVSKTVTVNPTPAPITGPSTVAVGGTITLSDATPGGMWICGATGTATITAGGVVTGVSAGTVNIYYTVGGCGVYKTITVSSIGGGAPVTASAPSAPVERDVIYSASKSGEQGAISESTPADGTLSIYPNPTNGNLTIEWKDQVAGSAPLIITDVTGRTVYQSVVNMDNTSGLQQISLTDLKSGIYLISIKSATAHFSSKLVIQR